jgi:cytochrome c biogenesis protein CcmG, thiol:disulfide interchange protein DsbE
VRRAIVPALAALAVAGLIAFEALTAGSPSTTRPAPPLPTSVLQPPQATLASLRGEPALVDFWASWCDPCRKEAPELERLDRTLRGSARLVGVDYTDADGSARAYLRRYRWTFPVLSDPDGVYGTRYGVEGLPTAFVLDSGGRIVRVLRGPQTVASLRAAIDPYIG